MSKDEAEQSTIALAVEKGSPSLIPTDCNCNSVIGTNQKPQQGQLPRAWFEGLSKEDRLAVLGFRDSAFLTAFLAVAPWCNQLQRDPETASYTSGK